jgi:hypothetical protein
MINPEYYHKRFKYAQQGETASNADLLSQLQQSNSSLSSSIDDSNHQPSSPSTPSPQANSTPIMPLSSITNKLNPQKPIDFASAYSGIASASMFAASSQTNNFQSNYYNNNANNTQTQTSYENAYSGFHSAFGHYNNPTAMNTAPTAGQFHSQLNSNAYYSMSNSQIGNVFGTNPSTRFNTNNRNSTGSTSADSSSASLNSPPSSSSSSSTTMNYACGTSGAQTLASANAKQSANVFDAENLSPNLLNSSLTNASSLLLRIKPNGSEPNGSLPIKKRRAVPVENKDNSYWEKRRKNNESAKRSRDLRRNKEEHISIRVIYLEQENLQLRTEVALLRSETEKLRSMLYQANGQSAATSSVASSLISSH